jgi:hypothetical protein
MPACPVECGRRRLVGGQNNVIVDIAISMAQQPQAEGLRDD